MPVKVFFRTFKFRYYFKRLKLSSICIIFLFMIFIYLCYLYRYLNLYSDSRETSNIKCEVTSAQRQHLFSLLKEVTDILEKLEIMYFLCYLSLWGAIRESGPLPWSSNADLCILNSDFLRHDETSLFRNFQTHSLKLDYNSADGEYIVRNSSNLDSSLSVRLILFELDSKLGGMYRRIGWKRRQLPPDCDAQQALDCFPPHLITPPLQKKSFGPLSIPAPREDIDLLKFQYPDTWWKPLKPSC